MEKEYSIKSIENLLNIEKNKSIPLRTGITGCFDWLSVTFNCFTYEPDNDFTYACLDTTSQNKIKSLLYFFDRDEENIFNFDRESGANGFKYKICLQTGCYLLFYGSTTQNGVPATGLNITGQGCQWLIQRGKFYGLLKYCLDNCYRFTRFDCAIDNYLDLMPLSLVNELVIDRSYTSTFRSPFRINGTPNPDSDYGYDGITYYLGNQSDLLLRIYAKNWKEEVEKEIKNWTRWEIQIRDHERISQLVVMIIIGYEDNGVYQDYFNIVAGLLKEVVMFKVKGTDSNKSRWLDHPEYLKFLNYVNNIKLFHAPKGKSDFQITKNWFEKSCLLVLTQIFIVMGKEKFFNYLEYNILFRYESMKLNEFNSVKDEYERLGKEFNLNEVYKLFNDFRDKYNAGAYEGLNSVLKMTEQAIEEFKQRELEEKGCF